MNFLTALRFRLMFAWVAFLRRFVSYGTGNNIASWTVCWLHPKVSRQKPAYLSGLNKSLGDNQTVRVAWQRHKALVGVTRLQSSYYSQDDISWINQCDVTIEGAEFIHSAHQVGKGVLTMTFHHHFNMLFCNLLGRLNLPITTIAMSARNSAKYQKFGARSDRIYSHAEKHLNGGKIILVEPNSLVRPILRAFENNHLVISANDFPNVYDDKNRKDFPFLDTQLSCPTGTVKLAVKKQTPIVAGYLDWLGGSRFKLVIRPVSDGSENMKIKTAMENYLAILEDMVGESPGLWEGWKWL